MSTTAMILDADVKPTSVTYSVITVEEKVVDKKTQAESTRTVLKPTQNEKMITEAKKDGTLLFDQSFSYDIPGTFKGITLLDIPEEEKVNIFRQGLVAKINRAIVSTLAEQEENGDPKFQPVEGNFDARPFAAEISGRRGLTETEKAMNTFKSLKASLPEDVFASLLAGLMAQSAPAATSGE